MPRATPDSAGGLLVVLPSWVGDVVLATPTLAALRAHFSGQRIAFLLRPHLSEVVAGGDWHDTEFHWPAAHGLAGLAALLRLARQIRPQGFHTALLLTNSFRSALLVWLAGIPRRVGYARDGRRRLLTDRLEPLRDENGFVPASVVPYYAAVARHVGCPVDDLTLRLGVTPEQENAGRTLARRYGLNGPGSYAIINPGAAFGSAKCWLPERFSVLCDRLHRDLGLRAVLVGAPDEMPLLRRIANLASAPVVCCERPATTLGSLKPLVRDAAVLVCNDTGPRHYGNALRVPTVTIFGPTDPRWTQTDYAGERRLQAEVPCGPCQLRRCPIDHRCMKLVTVDDVLAAVRSIYRPAPAAAAGGGEPASSARSVEGT